MASNTTHRTVYPHLHYSHRHIGGDVPPTNRTKYMKEQFETIKERNTHIPPYYDRCYEAESERRNSSTKSQSHNQSQTIYPNTTPTGNRYDPYIGYLYDHGLLDDGTNRRRFETHYIDINSENRIKTPIVITDDDILLDNNPISVSSNTNIVSIYHKKHNYEIGDRITISGASVAQTILRTIDDNGDPSFIIPSGCNIMKVFYSHNIPQSYKGTDIVVEISGVKGDRGSLNNITFLGNVPINYINKKHIVLTEISPESIEPTCDLSGYPPDFLDYSPDSFFILLPTTMHDLTPEPPYELRSYNYKISILTIGTIPINYINAKFPISPSVSQGFHNIISTTKDTYSFEVNATSAISDSGGGSSVYVSRITSINTGYPNPNKYFINLGKIYQNVVKARLVSIEFPNSETIINESNNKIYWNNIDDGETLYQIEVPIGNYTPQELEKVLEDLFFNTPRVNTGEDVGSIYTENHLVKVSINQKTDEVQFSIFKEFNLVQPFISIIPDISLDPNTNNNLPGTRYELVILQNGHNLQVGDDILITGAISTFGIPADVINGEHKVFSVIDFNTYSIQLPPLNLSNVRFDTRGGEAVNVFTPDKFRLRFDFQDTMGDLLGFRNAGEETSITSFKHTISNKDPYEFDISRNIFGEEIVIENNALQLSGENYVLLVADPLRTLTSTGPIKEAFAKILLCDLPGRIIFNSHVPTHEYYNDPLHEVFELEICFYKPNGELYDFNGLEHSMTIEITTVADIPCGTGINSNTGKNYNT